MTIREPTLVPAAELAARNHARFPGESAEYRRARNALLAVGDRAPPPDRAGRGRARARCRRAARSSASTGSRARTAR